MNKTDELKEWYTSRFNNFEQGLNGESKKPLHQLRKAAIAEMQSLPFPDTGNEEWKYTNIEALLSYKFSEGLSAKPAIKAKALHGFQYKPSQFTTLVFVNGIFNATLSKINDTDTGLVVIPLKEALEKYPEIIEAHLSKYADFKKNIFSAINTSFLSDGTFINLQKGSLPEKPIHILYITDTANEIVSYPRNLFVIGENAQVQVVESYEVLSGNTYFTNTVTEIVLERNAKLNHIRVQNDSVNSFHISTTEIRQKTGSNYTSYNINFGGKITRNNINAVFTEKDAECHLFGLYIGNEGQLIDNHTMIDHAMPHCNSNESYKGVLNGNARAVFNGKVMVRPDAQKTNAFQQNKNILLSKDAHVDTKPQLEIFADDVKCSHGATVGQLDAEALFYLRSRGFGPELARSTLVFAFAEDIVASIKVDSIRAYLESKIAEKLNG